jgi:hypothetical protein
MALGDWGELGRPLMSGTATYRTRITLPTASNRLRVTLPQWRGATWRATLAGGPTAIAAHGESEVVLTGAFAAGAHQVSITLASCLFNMMGPHHGPGLPGRWSWERTWEPARAAADPGAAWLRQPVGLLAEPIVAV